ncbi:MAG: hypothetical protein EHM23_26810 [Acidobacteria bacterium]|nr:MAG: hypothetical protein EHM23_26810 [Acidobacteriota bacterium]
MRAIRPSDGVLHGQLLELVKLATLAPSKYNTQPWTFTIEDHAVRICPDLSRRLPVADPHNRALYISLGCALENLLIGAECYGLRPDVEYNLQGKQAHSVVVHLTRTLTCADHPQLLRAIAERQTTRGKYSGERIAPADLRTLVDASREPGVHFGFLIDSHEVRPILAAFRESNRRLLADRNFLAEMMSWIRFTGKEAERRKDGISNTGLGLPLLPSWLVGNTTRRFLVRHRLRREKLIQGSAAVMLFAVDRNDPQHWIAAGRSFERVALTATNLHIRHSHLAPARDVVQTRIQLSSLLGLSNTEKPALLLRIGYAEPLPASLRRPVAAMLHRPAGGAVSGSRRARYSWRPASDSVHGVHGDKLRGISLAREKAGLGCGTDLRSG